MRRDYLYRREILLGLLLWFFTGCGTSSYYILSVAPPTPSIHTKPLPIIGVEKVIIPEYMQKGKVAVERSTNEIVYLEGSNWASDINILLTKEMIGAIQKGFNHPEVYTYPWDFTKQPEIKIKISINRFIAKGGYVYIDANYTIKNLRSKKSYSRLFRERIPAAEDPASIVAGMSGAYGKLTHSIIRDLHQRF